MRVRADGVAGTGGEHCGEVNGMAGPGWRYNMAVLAGLYVSGAEYMADRGRGGKERRPYFRRVGSPRRTGLFQRADIGAAWWAYRVGREMIASWWRWVKHDGRRQAWQKRGPTAGPGTRGPGA